MIKFKCIFLIIYLKKAKLLSVTNNSIDQQRKIFWRLKGTKNNNILSLYLILLFCEMQTKVFCYFLIFFIAIQTPYLECINAAFKLIAVMAGKSCGWLGAVRINDCF